MVTAPIIVRSFYLNCHNGRKNDLNVSKNAHIALTNASKNISEEFDSGALTIETRRGVKCLTALIGCEDRDRI